MKKLKTLLLVVAVMAGVTSCNVQKPSLHHLTYTVNYMEAGQGKVFITESNSVSFEYEPIGSIVVEEHPGYTKVTVPTTQRDWDYEFFYGKPQETKVEEKFQPATPQGALNYAAEQAMTMGGDGMINLKISRQYYKSGGSYVVVSGMVIKRK